MVDPARLLAQLTLHEGKRLFPYRDSVGKLTIGIGHNLMDRGLSAAAVAFIFQEDVTGHWAELVAALPWVETLSEVRQRVLLDMAFNLGIPSLLTFKQTLAAIQRGDYWLASVGMLRSKWAAQVGARAARLATMMETGEDSADF